MSLSERERKVLEEMERGLYAEDADLAKRFRQVADQSPQRKRQRNTARLLAGALVAVGGLMVILTGAMVHYPLIGVAGFAMTLTGLIIASTGSLVKPNSVDGGSTPSGSARSGKGARRGLMQLFEDRWDDRLNGR
jgi:hypothetical protein